MRTAADRYERGSMSVLVTLRMRADPKKIEEYAASDPGRMEAITDIAKRHGLIAHRFYGTDGHLMVVDEWPDRESFEAFFQEAMGQIQPMMEAAGVREPPHTEFWETLETHDKVGWGA
jgi:quinol monooxygenase YgiN